MEHWCKFVIGLSETFEENQSTFQRLKKYLISHMKMIGNQ